MLEYVEVVVAALAAGAAVGAGDVASSAVKDLHQGMKSLAARAMKRERPLDDAEVDQQMADPATQRDLVVMALAAADEDEREQLVTAARRVSALVGPPESAGVPQRVVVRDNQGVAVGFNSKIKVTNHFGGA